MTETNKKTIIHKIQMDFFENYKKREINRLQLICKCNPEANVQTANEYYDCVDNINKSFEANQKILNADLLKIDNKYEEELKKCASSISCSESATVLFDKNIRKRYADFYMANI